MRVRSQELAGVAHPLTNRQTSLGRDASNSIVVRNPTASRFHAEARREAGGFALHSMGATGTMLNGVVIRKPRMLEEGDMVEIAFTKLRFTWEPPEGAMALAAPHTTRNDEAGRKATLAVGGVAIPQKLPEPAKRGASSRRTQLVVALILFGSAAYWWFSRPR